MSVIYSKANNTTRGHQMKVIAIANQKGGTGKTTIALALAAKLGLIDGHRVQLIDLDFLQKSAYTWNQHAEGKYFDVVPLPASALANHVKRNASSYDYFIVDCPPRADEDASKIINASDYILVPVQPSPYDVWASGGLIELITAKRALTAGIPGMPKEGTPRAGLMLSCVIKNTRIAREVHEVMRETGIPVLAAHTTQFDTYKRAALEGKTLFDCKEKNAEAIAQINALADEITRGLHDD